MKKLLKYLLYLVLFCFMMIVFLPKLNIYYLGLEKLQASKVKLVAQNVEDNYISFDIENLDAYFNSINVAKIESTSIHTYILSSSLTLSNIKANDVLKTFIPEYIKKVTISHNLFKDPFQLDLQLLFKKGNAFGHIDLVKNKIVINLDVSNTFIRKYKNITNKFKKNGKYYTYEYQY